MVDYTTTIYIVFEIILAVQISGSNFLVLLAYCRSTHLRTITNTYIFSLAITDFLAGCLGIPLTVYSVLTCAPHSFYACLAIHLFLCALCTISTFHLLAIAVDKYLSICCKGQLLEHRHRYGRARTLLVLAWVLGSFIGAMPMLNMFGFAEGRHTYSGLCHFTQVVDYYYLVYVIFFATIILPTFVIIFCYLSIYRTIWQEEHHVRTLLRASERAKRHRQRKGIIRSLLLVVVAFFVCWYPLYTINSINFFFPHMRSHPAVTLSMVVLSHLNCALNPVIYAYGLPGFKQVLRQYCGATTSRSTTTTTCANSPSFALYGRDSSRFSTRLRTLNNPLSTRATLVSVGGKRSVAAATHNGPTTSLYRCSTDPLLPSNVINEQNDQGSSPPVPVQISDQPTSRSDDDTL